MTKPIKIRLSDELRELHRLAAVANRAAAVAWKRAGDRIDDPECERLTELAWNASLDADQGNGFLPWTKNNTPQSRAKAHDGLAYHHAHMSMDVEHDSLWAVKRQS